MNKCTSGEAVPQQELQLERGTTDTMKRQTTEGEGMFADGMIHEGLIASICKQLTQFNIQRKTTQFKNGQKTYFREEMMVTRHMK